MSFAVVSQPDLLTCGDCHSVFTLANINAFIEHKKSCHAKRRSACLLGGIEADYTDDGDRSHAISSATIAAAMLAVGGSLSSTSPPKSDSPEIFETSRAPSTCNGDGARPATAKTCSTTCKENPRTYTTVEDLNFTCNSRNTNKKSPDDVSSKNVNGGSIHSRSGFAKDLQSNTGTMFFW